jgi:hypothetical protein
MCRRLGKKHVEYVNRLDNAYAVGEDGVKRMRRMHNGARVVDHHGANVLNAYTDLRDKYWSWFPDQTFKTQCATKAKAKKLARLQQLTNHGCLRHGKARRAHLARNHVRVNPRVN